MESENCENNFTLLLNRKITQGIHEFFANSVFFCGLVLLFYFNKVGNNTNTKDQQNKTKYRTKTKKKMAENCQCNV